MLKDLVDDGLSSSWSSPAPASSTACSPGRSRRAGCAPANPYALAKDSCCASQLQHLQRELPFALTWARLFYLHGEGQAETALLPQLRHGGRARGDARFPMSGGERLRDYLADRAGGRSPRRARREQRVSTASSTSAPGVRSRCARSVEGWIAANGWPIGLDLGRYPYPAHEPMAFWGDAAKLIAMPARLPSRARRRPCARFTAPEQLPVLQNRMFASARGGARVRARRRRAGQSRATGLIFNAAFSA